MKITNDIRYVGVNDHQVDLFEGQYVVPNGMSYNSYVILDEKVAVMDTVDAHFTHEWLDNITSVLGDRHPDYLIIQHMEPDHAANIANFMDVYRDTTIVSSKKAFAMMAQFFGTDYPDRQIIVKEGDSLTLGKHTLAFVEAPMVHWPETMMTFDETDGILFSGDGFGCFGTLDGGFVDTRMNIDHYWGEMVRYYSNIVGKYGTQVQALLKKAAGLEIEMICPLHGPVWRKDIAWFLDKYIHWATYTPEDDAVVIAYASVYGGTENAANVLAAKLSDLGVRNVQMYDVSVTHPSYILSECFRASHLVFISTTYNAGMFVTMENLVHDIVHHNLQNRTIALMENGSWAPTAAGLMRAEFQKLKNCTILDETVTIKSTLKESQLADVETMAQAIFDSMPKPVPAEHKADAPVEKNAFFSFSYGLFVLTARDGEKDNGCIINTAAQLTDTPKRISIAVNKANFTHDMIRKTGVFNLSMLSTDAPFGLFQHYGFQSGRDVDKFADVKGMARATNGVYYLPYSTNAFVSGKVTQEIDLGTHTLFIADVTEARVLSDAPSMTYSFYFANVKPKPSALKKQTGWVCKICGYVYEGETLPADFICPLCKHGAEDFEKLPE